jgi:hypothetical protein
MFIFTLYVMESRQTKSASGKHSDQASEAQHSISRRPLRPHGQSRPVHSVSSHRVSRGCGRRQWKGFYYWYSTGSCIPLPQVIINLLRPSQCSSRFKPLVVARGLARRGGGSRLSAVPRSARLYQGEQPGRVQHGQVRVCRHHPTHSDYSPPSVTARS